MELKTNIAKSTISLVCEAGTLRLKSTELPDLKTGDVLVQVKAIGLCRTDLYAIGGDIATHRRAFIPGHEFSGQVLATGSGVAAIQVDDRIVVNPVVGCGNCTDCKSRDRYLCSRARFMGVDFDGACREQVVLNQEMVHVLPSELSYLEAAFAEPVAATLAIFKAGIRPDQRGVVLGEGRIAELTRRVLTAKRFLNIEIATSRDSVQLPDSAYDFVIETGISTQLFREMKRLVRPRGTLVLKSRQHLPFEMVPRDLIQKEPRICFANYGRFEESVELLATRRVRVEDLIGPQFPLDEFQSAFSSAIFDESHKVFLVPRR